MKFNVSYRLHESGMYHVTLKPEPVTVAVPLELFWNALRSGELRLQLVEKGDLQLRLDELVDIGLVNPEFWAKYIPVDFVD